jgi:pyruvate dehydrogenase E1 component alpha subunit
MAPTKTASVSGRKPAAKSAIKSASKSSAKEFTGKNTPDFGKDQDLHAYRGCFCP